MPWMSLHNHSQYSILNSTLSVAKLADLAAQNNMTAVALTDNGNLYGAVDFYKACKEVKVKPIIGSEFWIAPTSRLEKKKVRNFPTSFRVTMLAKNKEGYRNLCKLSSRGFLEGFYYNPRIDKELLQEYANGLICLIGGTRASLAFFVLNGLQQELQNEIEFFQKTFNEDLYFELQRHRMQEEHIKQFGMSNESWLVQEHESYAAKQNTVNNALLDIAKTCGIKYVATNDARYEKREDYKALEILLNIQSGTEVEIYERDYQGNILSKMANPKRETYPSYEFYFKNQKEMQALFSDLPKALANSLEIAEKCSFNFDFSKKYYPVFVPETYHEGEDLKETVAAYLHDLAYGAIEKRYTRDRLEKVKKHYPDKDPMEVVKERFEYEFSLISSKGMCDYFLIVHDFISWAKKQNIIVGPGRGSAAGSIISYLLGITDIEPLGLSLFFERFINPERIAYPDIDVDICMDRRSEVINYTIQKYGKEKVGQIITFGTMKAKMAIKDVGRVMSIPLAKVNSIAKLVPEDPTITLDRALEKDPDLKKVYHEDSDAKMIIDLAKTIEGSLRNTSTHAAGIIIAEDDLTNYIPVCVAKDSEMAVTQYAMKPAESVGMLKIDILGLKTLTSIQKTFQAIEKNHGIKMDWSDLSLEDKATYNLLNKGKTLGIFQMESTGMQELAKQLHIDTFEEIIAVVALYRPGPMDMIPSFIMRKHKKEVIEIEHPLMKDVLKETYGVIVYQEQVMQIASLLAGYSLAEGDVLRRAMGKKDRKEMTRQKEKFILGARKKNIERALAERIFDKIEKFASYGFNKSHAAAYAYLVYVTAYLKANYPREWMAALMTSDKDDLTKVAKFISECQKMKIDILLPDINESGKEFRATAAGIRFALAAIKGIGEGVVEEIVREREANGPYKNLYNFIQRVSKNKIGKKSIELLIDAGGFDFTNIERMLIKENLEYLFDKAQKVQKEKEQGILNLFSLMNEEEVESIPIRESFSNDKEILKKEKELLGFYLSSHPMKKYEELVKKINCIALNEMHALEHNEVVKTAFIVEEIDYKISNKSQRKFAVLKISDGVHRIELPIWPELYEKKQDLLNDNQLLFAILQNDLRDKQNPKLQCKWLEDLTKMDDKIIKDCENLFLKFQEKSGNKGRSMEETGKKQPLKIFVNADRASLSEIINMKTILKRFPGSAPVEIYFNSQEHGSKLLYIDASKGVTVRDELLNAIKQVPSFEVKTS